MRLRFALRSGPVQLVHHRTTHRSMSSFDLDSAVALGGAIMIGAYFVPQIMRRFRRFDQQPSAQSRAEQESLTTLLIESEKGQQDALQRELPRVTDALRRRLSRVTELDVSEDDEYDIGELLTATGRYAAAASADGRVLVRAADLVTPSELFSALVAEPDEVAPSTDDPDGEQRPVQRSLAPSDVHRLVALLVMGGIIPQSSWPPHICEPQNVVLVLGSEVWGSLGRNVRAVELEEYVENDGALHQALCCALLKLSAPQLVVEDSEEVVR